MMISLHKRHLCSSAQLQSFLFIRCAYLDACTILYNWYNGSTADPIAHVCLKTMVETIFFDRDIPALNRDCRPFQLSFPGKVKFLAFPKKKLRLNVFTYILYILYIHNCVVWFSVWIYVQSDFSVWLLSNMFIFNIFGTCLVFASFDSVQFLNFVLFAFCESAVWHCFWILKYRSSFQLSRYEGFSCSFSLSEHVCCTSIHCDVVRSCRMFS